MILLKVFSAKDIMGYSKEAIWRFISMISTKARYSLRVMVDLAQHQEETYVPLKEIAKRQKISEKYLEIILKMLV